MKTRMLSLILCCSFILCRKPVISSDLRVVSLSPAMTEIIFAIGAGKNLVGVTSYCDYPDSAKETFKVGDFSNPSLERIISVKPDIVIVNLPEQNRIKEQLNRLGIKVFISSPRTLEDIYNEIQNLGKILKKETKADSLVNYMRANLKAKNYSKKKVYVEISSRPLITIGKKSFINELIELTGGENIFSDLETDYPVVSQEQVIMRNPDIIIVLHPEDVETRIGWTNVNAIKNHRVYKDLNQDWLMRPGPRLVLGFKELEKVFD